jgi:hypothetical protein
MVFESRQDKRICLLSKNTRLAVVCTQPPSQWTPAFFPGGKATGREVDHSPSSGAEVKNEWNYTSVPSICLYGVDRDTFTFNFMFEFPCIISLYYIKI